MVVLTYIELTNVSTKTENTKAISTFNSSTVIIYVGFTTFSTVTVERTKTLLINVTTTSPTTYSSLKSLSLTPTSDTHRSEPSIMPGVIAPSSTSTSRIGPTSSTKSQPIPHKTSKSHDRTLTITVHQTLTKTRVIPSTSINTATPVSGASVSASLTPSTSADHQGVRAANIALLSGLGIVFFLLVVCGTAFGLSERKERKRNRDQARDARKRSKGKSRASSGATRGGGGVIGTENLDMQRERMNPPAGMGRQSLVRWA